ncbi:PAS domain S-box-containing protein [Caldanaerovirga acetigignens]|uniref:PAS domain S-box-containing protein n=1 Tax=Caldanaerovirga acetigignens TaxID=447595 RepID=A0A1M7L388_9FIRM|nr:sigma-54-dependent Fis family transcriptional regulator [Caldanaerovirga acetigignens]SHM72438.1 PAS domain S-box-containing protein [Caldanaerovirga acetigignens]
MESFASCREYIKRSHERCKSYGISRDQVYSRKIISGEELEKRLDKNRELITTAMPFMEQIYEFVKGSGFIAILTDNEGCILKIIGDERILSEAISLKMVPGAFMDERSIGTNAMGTVLVEGMPLQVSGDEHYIKAYHRWTCSAAPIREPGGEMAGVLDLTGYSEHVHSHTLGMVAAAASAIENLLQIKRFNEQLAFAKNQIETVVNAIPAGIVTADLFGKIKTFNKHAQEIFGYDADEIKWINIRDLFDGWSKVKSQLMAGKGIYDEEVDVFARKNRLKYSISAYPIHDGQGILKEIVCVFKEVKNVRKMAHKILGMKAVYTFDKIIGKNEQFVRLVEYAKKVANSRSTILITGESGTGKELFAQAIHNESARRDEPFVAINCGAIPRELIESELFGYDDGAFTGARRGGKPGKFEIADGGTLFLDEIGEMPLDMQVKLLRAIEDGVVTRIGGSRPIPVDVRIIAATNKDLEQEVRKGNFRKDLYYRLNVIPLRLPPLRERKDDIPILIDYFMKRISRRLNKKPVEIPENIMKALTEYNWPGNIRELENFVEFVINSEGIIPVLVEEKFSMNITLDRDLPNNSLEAAEKEHILRVLEHNGWNITSAARDLGIGRNTLYRKIKKYNLGRCAKKEHCSIMEH